MGVLPAPAVTAQSANWHSRGRSRPGPPPARPQMPLTPPGSAYSPTSVSAQPTDCDSTRLTGSRHVAPAHQTGTPPVQMSASATACRTNFVLALTLISYYLPLEWRPWGCTYVTATRITLRWCGIDRVPYHRIGVRICCFGFTPIRCVTVGRPRRTRPYRGVVPFLSRHLRTGACSATQTAYHSPCRRVTLFLPSSARVARLIPATRSRLPPTPSVDTTRDGSRGGVRSDRRSPNIKRTILGWALRTARCRYQRRHELGLRRLGGERTARPGCC
ncbi:Uncharacterised protein [Rhodococcus wratislaviensis]|uniref:Basic proline-rich protein n=1 Tax=Rhodococcus wratislaviensis TaxID=44752 RepID=A0AB38F7D4_RHOWR|nr:Uncharacterised protein [Rhodococcus wratislaviensis]